MPLLLKQPKFFEQPSSSLMAIGLIIVATTFGIWGSIQYFYKQDIIIVQEERLQLKDWEKIGIISMITTLLVTGGVFKGLSTSLAVSIFVATGMFIQVGLALITLRKFVGFIFEGFEQVHSRRNRGLAEGYFLLGCQISFLFFFLGLVINNAEMPRKKK